MTLRYFGGTLTVSEVAERGRGVSKVTVERDWRLAQGSLGSSGQLRRGTRGMTPDRWRQIGDLFDAAVRIDPPGPRGGLAPRAPAAKTTTCGPRSAASLAQGRAGGPGRAPCAPQENLHGHTAGALARR